LVRSAAYRSATTSERRLAHAALAAVTDRSVDGEHWAWHRAQSVVAPDEDVARALEESAERAIALGGMAAAAAFLDAAATLTPDPVRRSGRCLGAAQAKIAAGAFDDASRLLATAEMGPVGHAERATIELLRAQLLFLSDRGNEALPLLLGAAGKLEAVNTNLARDTYLDAFAAAHFAGRLAVGADARDVAVAALACDTRTSPSKRDLLLESLALTHTAGYAAAVPPACQAVQAFVSEDLSVDDALRFSWLAAATAASLWDDVAWDALTRRHLDVARKFGALSAVPLALTSRVMPELFRGNFRAAASYVAEVHALAEVTAGEGTLAPYGDVCLQALQGDERRAEALIHQCLDDVTARGEGVGINMAHWARSALLNSLGRYGEALHAAQISAAAFLEPGPPKWALAELVEAAVYARELPVAKTAMGQLSELTQASGTDWALGVEASRGALLAEGPSAEALHREAIDRLASTSMRLELARAQLLFGEFLRRGARRVDARVQLRAADEAFASMGAQAFAARARRELLATGETARKRTVDTVDQLTPQEAAIADLAAELLTNAEIGAALYISARTVEWHLRKVYAKLRVSTKRELRAARAPAAS
jgi:DNA-binding CsgD family transcriptional regulator